MSKPVIQKIKFTKEQQQEIDLINERQVVSSVNTVIDKKTGNKRDIVFKRRFSEGAGRKRLRELYNGICITCGSWPNYIVSRDVGDKHQGAKLIERYCESCFSKWEERIKR